MGQIAIYIDPRLKKELDEAAKEEEVSRSSWVQEAIQEKLRHKSFTGDWFQLWGTWEDHRPIEEILEDIDQGYLEVGRSRLR